MPCSSDGSRCGMRAKLLQKCERSLQKVQKTVAKMYEKGRKTAFDWAVGNENRYR